MILQILLFFGSTGKRQAFTLVELMVVVVIFGFLVFSSIIGWNLAMQSAHRTSCASNLRQLQAAYSLYLEDHQGQPFAFVEDIPEGRLWYFGLEPGSAGGTEGRRVLDPSRARLAPYLGTASVSYTCPSLPYKASSFKQKYSIRSMGYGINCRLLTGLPGAICNWAEVSHPAEFLVWADSIQINTMQAPASVRNPMLEEWYYVSDSPPASFHFRHGGLLNAAFGDGSVRSLSPGRLDRRCDGQVGYLKTDEAKRWLNPTP